MTQKEDAPSKAVRKAIVRRVVVAAKAAKQSAKAVWRTDRTLPPPVEIEPHGLNRPALHRLGQERQRLLDEMKRQGIVIQDHPTTGTHMADDASDVTEQVTILALRRHLEGLLQEVERAMVRAERGLYGWCERCGHPISAERFQYEAAGDLYHCPQGMDLTLYSRREREEVLVYRAPAAVCNQCPAKADCTGSRSGRHIFRSFFQEYVDRMQAYHETAAYQKALRKRMVWVEPLFGEAKQWHQRARFRLRGLRKVNMDGLLTAAGQNIKRLLKRRWPDKRQAPDAAAICLEELGVVGMARKQTDRAARLFGTSPP